MIKIVVIGYKVFKATVMTKQSNYLGGNKNWIKKNL